MYLHEVKDHENILREYTVEGTPYTVRIRVTLMFGNLVDIRRNDRSCRQENAGFERRFAGMQCNAATAVAISEWLQGCWAKYVDLALTIGEVP